MPDDAALIARWSVAAQRDGILAVHGSPHNPLMGHLSDERDVRAALRRLPGWLCAHGHTHQAALWISRPNGTIERQRRPTSQRLGRSMRAVACPGALSGPDPHWLLVDTVRRRLTWHRIDLGRTTTASGARRAARPEAALAEVQSQGLADAPGEMIDITSDFRSDTPPERSGRMAGHYSFTRSSRPWSYEAAAACR